MNILFIANTTINPSHGGVERTTYNIAQELTKRGYNCFAIFPSGDDCVNDSFLVKEKIDLFGEPINVIVPKVVQFIERNNIDVVINQQVHSSKRISILNGIKQFTNVFIIYCFHGDPIIYTKKFLLKDIWKNITCKNILKFILYQFYISYKQQLIVMHHLVDKFVVLSQSQFLVLQQDYGLNVSLGKLCAIPNSVSSDELINTDSLDKKEHVVLIVARLHEKDKGILSSLRIWQEIKKSGDNNWKLQIVGDGPDRDMYEAFVAHWQIKDVCFVGNLSNPQPYYHKASLLMVTSPCEGFGMTLIEALQFGCVPIVFNSFSALCDIITDGVNGRVIPNNDENEFAHILLLLMNEKNKRLEMAISGLHLVGKFSKRNVAQNWVNILESR